MEISRTKEFMETGRIRNIQAGRMNCLRTRSHRFSSSLIRRERIPQIQRMIIDAMDILYAKDVDGFCIVSSDSDFTRLVSRLRESGKMVIEWAKIRRRSHFEKHVTNSQFWKIFCQRKVWKMEGRIS